MKRAVSSLIVIGCQLFIVSFFFVTVFSGEVTLEKKVSTVHNENLNKIATSVSLLFENEEENFVSSSILLDDDVLSELPVMPVVPENKKTNNKKEEVIIKEEASYLSSIDASKYINNETMGFKVTENNKEYYLEGYEFDVVVAVVAGEFDRNLNDALAVVSVILNRCDDTTWSRWSGSSPYTQVIAKGQFEVYFKDYYLAYMPGGSRYQSDKYYVAKQALIDGMNGIRNNKYTGFRAWGVSSYSDKYIVYGGNRYGFN